jgi:ATP-dependent Clp protease ATP-binding subunit ClpA
MFERFSPEAVKVIMLAQEESRRLKHPFVGSEQILLALIAEDRSPAAKALKKSGINLKNARTAVESLVGKGAGFVPVEIPFTQRAKHLLESASEYVSSLNLTTIRPEHILVGILAETEGTAIRTLTVLNVSADGVRSELETLLDLPPGAARFTPAPPPPDCAWCGEKLGANAQLCKHCQRPVGDNAKRCSQCAEVIWRDAVSCRFCQFKFS